MRSSELKKKYQKCQADKRQIFCVAELWDCEYSTIIRQGHKNS